MPEVHFLIFAQPLLAARNFSGVSSIHSATIIPGLCRRPPIIRIFQVCPILVQQSWFTIWVDSSKGEIRSTEHVPRGAGNVDLLESEIKGRRCV